MRYIPVLEVDFGAYNYTGDGVHAAKVDNLVVDDLNHVERLVVCHGVDENEAMDANGMLGVENSVLVLGKRRDEGRVVVVGDESV